jgi:hypothetical protein
MKLSSPTIISLGTLIAGYAYDKVLIWIPISILAASLIFAPFRGWVMSDRLGTSVNTSMIIKFVLGTVGFYATMGQFLCLGLLVWWFLL